MNTRVPAAGVGADDPSGLRSDVYALLAAMLAAPPAEEHLQRLTGLTVLPEARPVLGECLHRLKKAAAASDVDDVHREYADLFVGMGRGQVVPYASWYGERLLMSAPLARLRTDLAPLNIQRQAGAAEPEDHAGALCEIMLLVIARQVPVRDQARFFQAHLDPWMTAFFRDLHEAPAADFYAAVGKLGERFMLLERQHLRNTLEKEVMPP